MKHKVTFLVAGWVAILSVALSHGQPARAQAQATGIVAASSAAPSSAREPATAVARLSAPDVGSAAKQRALLDQYCVVCHNDKLKTANLSLEKLDLTTAGEHPELWEKVVRKLRAGVMPPPGLPRPALTEYEGLRDWLESEIDRTAATHVNPGAVVLHRLNRTEYANVV